MMVLLWIWKGLVFLVLPVIALGGVLLFSAFLRQEKFTIYFLMFSILPGSLGLFEIGGGKAPPILFLDIAVVLIGVATLWRGMMTWQGVRGLPLLVKLFLVFLFWLVLSSIHSDDLARSLAMVRNYSAGLLALLITRAVVLRESDAFKVVASMLVWGCLLSFLEFYQLWSLGNLGQSFVGVFLQKNLISLDWGRSNYLSAFDVLLIPIGIALFLGKSQPRIRLLSIVSVVLMTSALVLSLSKGALVAATVSLLLVIARGMSPRAIVPVMISLTVIILMVVLNPLGGVLVDRVLVFDQALSFQSRLVVWEESWNTFMNNPLTGVGLGSLGNYITFVSQQRTSAHNIFLGLLAETGVAGCLLFFAMICTAAVEILRAYSRATNELTRFLLWGIFSSLVGIVVHSMVEPTFEGFQFSIMAWTMIGVGVSLGGRLEPGAFPNEGGHDGA
ncbi:MAG: O-antigen ligase family protein [Ignavibacteria bacterium]|nr:O-antigen ligase family protein [Ignavibacteria bacterium]